MDVWVFTSELRAPKELLSALILRGHPRQPLAAANNTNLKCRYSMLRSAPRAQVHRFTRLPSCSQPELVAFVARRQRFLEKQLLCCARLVAARRKSPPC
eukprot:IDg14630t1